MSLALEDVRTHRWSVEEYEKLAEGFFGTQRVELLNGQLIEMSPMGYRHGEAVDRLNEAFTLVAKARYRVRVLMPFILSKDSMPEPDLCLYQKPKTLRHHPKTEHVLLAIEVADSTLRYDRGDKKAAYALQGITEYWLLNLQGNVLEVYLDPVDGEFATVRSFGPEDTVSPRAFPDIELRVGDYIP